MENNNMTAWQKTMKAHDSATTCASILGRSLSDAEYIWIQKLGVSVYNAQKPAGPKCTGHCCTTKVVNGVGYAVAEIA